MVDGLKYIYGRLLQADISVLTDENREFLTTYAMALIKKNHSEEEKEALKLLIQICNILYNRTDLEVLPIEDGVYDLLMEAYKRYDPNFQVGSAVVNFKAKIEPSIEDRPVKKAIFFYDKRERDPIQQHCFEELRKFNYHQKDEKDLYRQAIFFNGSDIGKRTHDTEHKHPDLVGTLDKCKFVTVQEAMEAGVENDPNVAILERDFFIKHINDGIITPNQNLTMVLELKYDGISVEADCNRYVQSARSRGDTGAGKASDMTPILKGYPFVHQELYVTDRTVGVKFEAIMTKSNLYKFNQERGYSYANCRTAIVGLFGANDAWKFRDYITLIPLAIDRDQVPEISNRIEEIEFCNRLFRSHGEPLRYMVIQGNYQQCLYQIKKFTEEAFAFRDYVDFMFDGIVVSYLDENIRHKLGRKNFVNKYSMAVKFNPLSKLTTFREYTFEVGQDGRITPMYHYDPVEFFGTIHTKSSGSSYARFMEGKIKPGDIIKVTYRNDVMPYVSPVDCEHNRRNKNVFIGFPMLCPICGSTLVLSDSGKSMMCQNNDCPARVKGRMVNMLQKLNAKGFADAAIEALGVKKFSELMSIDIESAKDKIGPTNAINLENMINHIKNDGILDYVLIGSLGFTSCAALTWKPIFELYRLPEFVAMMEECSPNEIMFTLGNIPGVGPVTAQTIIDEYPYFRNDFYYIMDAVNVISFKDQKDQYKLQIRFSGCRDLQLQEQLNNLGYDCDGKGSVTKTTDILLIPYEGYKSNKTSKVSPSCKVIPIDLFKSDMQKYL